MLNARRKCLLGMVLLLAIPLLAIIGVFVAHSFSRSEPTMRVSEDGGPWHDATPEEAARYQASEPVMPMLPNGERAVGGIFGGSGDTRVYDRHGNHWVKRGMHWELTDP